MSALLARVDFPGGFDSRRVRPHINADNQAYYDGLVAGTLLLPQCTACGRTGVPIGPACAWCGSADRSWRRCSGRATIHSWVRYHRAFLPEFEGLIPYVVIAAHLEEGPVLFGRWLSGSVPPRMDAPVRAAAERWADGFCGVAFVDGGP